MRGGVLEVTVDAAELDEQLPERPRYETDLVAGTA